MDSVHDAGSENYAKKKNRKSHVDEMSMGAQGMQAEASCPRIQSGSRGDKLLRVKSLKAPGESKGRSQQQKGAPLSNRLAGVSHRSSARSRVNQINQKQDQFKEDGAEIASGSFLSCCSTQKQNNNDIDGEEGGASCTIF